MAIKIDQQASASGDANISAENPRQARLPREFGSRFESAQELKAFLDEKELLEKIPVCRRTLNSWRKKKLIPFIRLPGTRRVLYDFELVRAAFLRMGSGE
jgi:hypothetical protein